MAWVPQIEYSRMNIPGTHLPTLGGGGGGGGGWKAELAGGNVCKQFR